MRLKKKVKRIILVFLIIALLVVCGLFVKDKFFDKEEVSRSANRRKRKDSDEG